MNKNKRTPHQTNKATSQPDINAPSTCAPENIDISSQLKPPGLQDIDPDAITYEHIHAGISVHIPHSPLLQPEDLITFHWGLHQASTRILQTASDNNIAGVLYITYNFITHVQYGPVELYYEIYRSGRLIGTSPCLRVTVNNHAPLTLKQRRRKRSMKRRHTDK